MKNTPLWLPLLLVILLGPLLALRPTQAGAGGSPALVRMALTQTAEPPPPSTATATATATATRTPTRTATPAIGGDEDERRGPSVTPTARTGTFQLVGVVTPTATPTTAPPTAAPPAAAPPPQPASLPNTGAATGASWPLGALLWALAAVGFGFVARRRSER